MSYSNSSDVQFAIKKILGTLAKPIAIILVFTALALFLLKTISNINVR